MNTQSREETQLSMTVLTQVVVKQESSMHYYDDVHAHAGARMARDTTRSVCAQRICGPAAMPDPTLACGKPLLFTEGWSTRRNQYPSAVDKNILMRVANIVTSQMHEVNQNGLRSHFNTTCSIFAPPNENFRPILAT